MTTTTSSSTQETRPADGSRADALFVAAFGYLPVAVWAAPGRVNVIGEHTDYNGGFVLPMAIDRYTHVAAAPRTDGLLRLVSSAGGPQPARIAMADLAPSVAAVLEADEQDRAAEAPATETSWTAYPAGVAWTLREAGLLPPDFAGADLAFGSTVPVGAGLSSSAALECATGLALAGLAGIELPADELARLAQKAENDYVGVPCGPLDQLSSAHGLDGAVLFIDTRSLEVTPYPFDLASAGLTLLVCDTHVQHDLGGSGYPERRSRCESAARVLGLTSLRELGASGPGAAEPSQAAVEQALATAVDQLDEVTYRRVQHVVSENFRVRHFVDLLAAGPLDADRAAAAGKLMTASHTSLRYDYEVSCEELDAVVDAALAAGALGARMTGGGFGGSAIALVPLGLVDRVVAAVRAAQPQVGFFPAVAARGAHRVR